MQRWCQAADDCPWYAHRLYLDLAPLKHTMPGMKTVSDYQGWPISVICDDNSPEARLHALKTGPYGRCVFYCDNNVVDHQVVNMEMDNGISVSMAMHGHSHKEGRTMRYDGTQANLIGHYYLDEQIIEIHDHLTGKVETIHPEIPSVRSGPNRSCQRRSGIDGRIRPCCQ